MIKGNELEATARALVTKGKGLLLQMKVSQRSKNDLRR